MFVRALGLTALAVLLFLVLALPLLPSEIFGTIAPYDAARALQGLVLLGTALLACWPPTLARLSLWPWPLLLLLGGVSCMMSAMPHAAWRDAVWTAAWLSSLLALASAWQSQLVRDRVLGALVIGQFAYVLLASATVLYGLLVEHLAAPWHAFPGYENPRYFNHTQTLSIPLLLAYSVWPRAALPLRRLAGVAVMLHFFLIGIFLARATVVSLVVASLLVCVALRERRLVKALSLYAALGALLYVVGFMLLPHLLGIAEVPAFRDAGDRSSIEARIYLWKIALQAVSEHPWLGIGPMHFAHTINGEAAHPHNIYLQVASEYGLPFVMTAVASTALWLHRRLQLSRQGKGTEDAIIEAGCLIAIVGALFDGLFSGNFVMPMSQSWIALCVALLLALQRGRDGRTEDARGHTMARVVRLGVAAAMAAVLVSMVQELAQSDVNLVHGPSLTPAQSNPRFWLDGWF
jgi:O-antigen ligase